MFLPKELRNVAAIGERLVALEGDYRNERFAFIKYPPVFLIAGRTSRVTQSWNFRASGLSDRMMSL